ncbi:hypothetical protein OROMI_020216 [Orobanche minor]
MMLSCPLRKAFVSQDGSRALIFLYEMFENAMEAHVKVKVAEGSCNEINHTFNYCQPYALCSLRGTKAGFVAVVLITFVILNCSKSKILLEEALESLTSLIDSFNESTGGDLLYIGTKTPALACQVYLDFAPVRLIDSESRVKTIAGLGALRSIVRWGIIKKDTLLSLECLLGEDDKYYVKNACWIISNITARKENHIKVVIDSGLIEPLVDVV